MMMKIFAFLICLCSVLGAVDYATLSDSKIYQKWLKDAQSNSVSGICTNPQDRRCQEAITESCETFINNSEDYEWCKNKIISTNTTAYGDYTTLTNDTPMAISAIIQAEDTSGLMAIIQAMPDIMGEDIATLEEQQGSNFIADTFCYENLSPQSLEILLQVGKLDPRDRKCTLHTSLLEGIKQKCNAWLIKAKINPGNPAPLPISNKTRAIFGIKGYN